MLGTGQPYASVTARMKAREAGFYDEGRGLFVSGRDEQVS